MATSCNCKQPCALTCLAMRKFITGCEALQLTSVALKQENDKINNQLAIGPPIVNRPFIEFSFLQMEHISNMYTSHKYMIILRGPPGSGKSTLSMAIQERFPLSKVFSSDKFFYEISATGKDYAYDIERISEAHTWCAEEALQSCVRGDSPILIDNTNIKRFEAFRYVNMAREWNYQVVMVCPQTPWFNDPTELASRNIHNVNLQVISKKLSSFEAIWPSYIGLFMLSSVATTVKSSILESNKIESNFELGLWCSARVCEMAPLIRYLTDGSWQNTNSCAIDPIPAARNRSPFHVTAYYMGSKVKTLKAQQFVEMPEFAEIMHGIPVKVPLCGIFCTKGTMGLVLDLPFSNEPILDKIWMQDDWLNCQNLTKRWKGCRAHMTVAVSGSNGPVQAGLDLLQIRDSFPFDRQSGKVVASEDDEIKHSILPRGLLWQKNNFSNNDDDILFYYELNDPSLTLSCVTGAYY